MREHGQVCSLELLAMNCCGIVRIQTYNLPAIGGNLRQVHHYKVINGQGLQLSFSTQQLVTWQKLV